MRECKFSVELKNWWGGLSVMMMLLFVFLLPARSQSVALKNNVIYGARGILNIGAEFPTFSKQTLALNVHYNPWEWGDNKKRQLLLFQPEYRFWFNDKFMGHFVGVQAHYGSFDYSKTTPLKNITNNRFDGTAIGCGLTYGYQFILSRHWNLETCISMGYARLNYKKYGPNKGDLLKEKSKVNYFGPTQLGLTFVYFML